ncbi:MAG: histidine--tRNA ligase, partial [Alphaproteobacteria bacterium]
MATLRPVRGTHDLLPEDARRHHAIIETAAAVAARYGFQPFDVPIFEFTHVFDRTLGESSDVVAKEMYSFTDRGGESITLRPELTAGIARAYVSNGLRQAGLLKVFASGPAFRYERPQKGRQRQFHQIDAEIIGAAEPAADVEIIALAADTLAALGVLSETVLQINTLGDTDSRQAYRQVLVAYLQDHRTELSADSQDRLTRNPLRVLDSKDAADRRIVEQAPVFSDSLNETSRDFFATVLDGLDTLGIAYRRNERLVRGLDYYCHTAFEFVTDRIGAQGTVLGGGRYDGLIELLGGPATPGIGWAAGIERLALMAVTGKTVQRPVAIVPVGTAAIAPAQRLAHELRQSGV